MESAPTLEHWRYDRSLDPYYDELPADEVVRVTADMAHLGLSFALSSRATRRALPIGVIGDAIALLPAFDPDALAGACAGDPDDVDAFYDSVGEAYALILFIWREVRSLVLVLRALAALSESASSVSVCSSRGDDDAGPPSLQPMRTSHSALSPPRSSRSHCPHSVRGRHSL